MENKKKNITETGYIDSSDLLDAIKEEKDKQKKECFLKKLFKKKNKVK